MGYAAGYGGARLAELWPERLLNGLVIRSKSAAALARVLKHLFHIGEQV